MKKAFLFCLLMILTVMLILRDSFNGKYDDLREEAPINPNITNPTITTETTTGYFMK
jgi:hypothetical protein